MTDFAGFAKWVEKQNPANIDWDRAAKDFPDYDLNRFKRDLLVRPRPILNTNAATIGEAKPTVELTELERSRLGRQPIQLSDIPEGVARFPQKVIGNVWDIGKSLMGMVDQYFQVADTGNDPDVVLSALKQVPKAFYEHYRGYIPTGEVTVSDVGRKLYNHPVDAVLDAVIVRGLWKSVSRAIGRTLTKAEVASVESKIAEGTTPTEALGEVVYPQSPRAGQLLREQLAEEAKTAASRMQKRPPKNAFSPGYPTVSSALTTTERQIPPAERSAMVLDEAAAVEERLRRSPAEYEFLKQRLARATQFVESSITPEQVGKKIGATYNGIQKSPKSGDFYTFTDDVSGNTFLVKDLTEAPKAIERIRMSFKSKTEPTKPAPVAEARKVSPVTPKARQQAVTAELKAIDEQIATIEEQKLQPANRLNPAKSKALEQEIIGLGERKKGLLGREKGQILIPTSEEITKAGQRLGRANLYTRFIGNRIWEKGIVAGYRRFIPKKIRNFIDDPSLPNQYVNLQNSFKIEAGKNIDEFMTWVRDRADKITPEESKTILDAITDPTRMGIEKLKPGPVKEYAGYIQEQMFGLENQYRELFPDAERLLEGFEFHHGRYLPKLNDISLWDRFKIGVFKLSGRTRKRGDFKEVRFGDLPKYEAEGWELASADMPEELGIGQKIPANMKVRIRKFVPYGDIQDPFVLAAKAVADAEHDFATLKFVKSVSDNPEWVSDVPKEGFVKLTNLDERIGRVNNIRDKYIREDMVGDFGDLIRHRSETNKYLSGLLSLWKVGKTAYNPPTHIRNIISNVIAADVIDGLSPARIDIYGQALKELATGRGTYIDDFKAASGIGTFYQAEIIEMLNATRGKTNPLSFFQSILKNKITGSPAKLYQAEEQWFKLASFIHNRQRGLSVAESMAAANKALIDYSHVSPMIRMLRRGPVPFATYPLTMAPRLIEAAIKHPFRVGKYYLAFEYLNGYAKRKLGLTDEEYEKVRENLPEEMKGNQWLLMPEKDRSGNYLFFNATYITPWGDLVTGGSWLPTPAGGTIENLLVPAHPLIRLPFELYFNKSVFGERTIAKPGENRPVKGLQYGAEAILPPSTPFIGRTAEGIRRNLISQKPDYFGDIKSRGRAIGDILGLRTTSVNVPRQRKFRLLDKRKQMEELRSRAYSIRMNRSLSVAEKNKKVADLVKQYRQIAQELRPSTK